MPFSKRCVLPRRSLFRMNARFLGVYGAFAMLFAMGGCSAGKAVTHQLFGKTTDVSPNRGIVAADEPQAALAGRDVLSRGGNAADAAAATGFALGVTLPSRASLGGGGACLVALPDGRARAYLFLPRPGSAAPSREADRPAAIPMIPRGLYRMQLEQGKTAFSDTLLPALRLARSGMVTSDVLAADLKVVQEALLADPAMRETFGRGGRSVVRAGDQVVQPRLGGFLERLQAGGVGDLYNGALSEVYAQGADQAGGGLDVQNMRGALAGSADPLYLTLHNAYGQPVRMAFLPPPADGGLGVAVALRNHIPAGQAVSGWRSLNRQGPSEGQAYLGETPVGDAAPLPALPASTSFVVRDAQGMQVGCVLSENNLFGTGRMAGLTGVVLGASPLSYPRPLYAAASLTGPDGRPQAMEAASGQNGAAQAIADDFGAVLAGRDRAGKPPGAGGVTNRIFCASREIALCRGRAEGLSGLAVRSGR